MKHNAFYMKNGNIVAEYGIDENEVARIRNRYGFVGETRMELINTIKAEEKRKAEWVKPYHYDGTITIAEMDAMQKEFAESMYTEEDKRIIAEIKRNRVHKANEERKRFYRHSA